jgi:hypothetical protein
MMPNAGTAVPGDGEVASNEMRGHMSKKQTPKKRQKLNAGKRQPKAKSRPVQQIDAEAAEDQAIGSDESTQSGDTQGLSPVADAGFESVKELAEEGQYLEAEVVEAVENAPNADAGPVKTKEVPEDDVPPEYRAPDLER